MSSQSTAFRFVPPAWIRGAIGARDADFLTALAREIRPAAIVEIGVASGWSSAVLLHAMASVPRTATADGAWLHSFDVVDRCYFNPARAVGEVVDEIVSDLRPFWRLHIGDARDAGTMLNGRDLTLGFIDADHRHPFPTLDLLALLPALRPGAWVALHDIRLASSGSGTGPGFDCMGTQYLFDEWPWAKRADGNIGAVRLDNSLDDTRTFCERLLRIPWEASIPRADLPLHGQFRGEPSEAAGTSADQASEALRLAADTGRPLFVWGAGAAGREFLTRLGADVRVSAIIDRDPKKAGTTLNDIPIRNPSVLDVRRHERPFVAVCSMYSQEIADDLDRRGLIAAVDYTIA